jgi:amidase
VATAGAADLARALERGEMTALSLAEGLLARIAALDADGPKLNAVLALSPTALAEAAALDAERAAGTVRGPLHGVPVLVKDNIEAAGLPGSAGSLALAGRQVARDATLVARLRSAGLVVLGATNLSEWANIRSSRSTSGWSAVGGLTCNPWAFDRSAGGSSSGSGAAIAGGLAPLAIGTETDGSITCPSSVNGCVGLKPTVGLLPTEGVVPISASQDAPGPMARSVRDAALLLDTLTGEPGHADGCGALAAADLRLGLPSAWPSGHDRTDALFAEVLDGLRAAGADVTEVAVTTAEEIGDDELTVLLCELHDDLDAYLAARPGDGVSSLADVVAFNVEHGDAELAHFGQEHFEAALTNGGRADEMYADARARCLAWAVDECLAPALADPRGPEILMAPAYAPAWKSDLVNGDRVHAGGRASSAPSIAGWPVLCLPMGLVDGLPVGLVLIGPPRTERRLLAVGDAVERHLGLADDGTLAPAWAEPGRG